MATVALDAGRLRNPWLLFALVCGSVVSLGLLIATAYGGGIGLDFSVLWKASRSPIAAVYTHDPYAPFVYPPTAIPWLKPLALLPMWMALVLWSAISLAAFLFVADVPKRWLLLASPALIQCLAFGQTSLLVASLILASSGGWIMGSLIGVAFTIKPQLVFLAPLIFLVRGEWKAFGAFAGAALAMTGLTLLLYGLQPWRDWYSAISVFHDVLVKRDLFWVMITPAGAAERFGLDPALPWAVGAGLALIAATRSAVDDVRPLIVYTSLLASPYAVTHDLVALLPFCLAALFGTKRKATAALIFSGVLIPLALAVWAVQDVLDD